MFILERRFPAEFGRRVYRKTNVVSENLNQNVEISVTNTDKSRGKILEKFTLDQNSQKSNKPPSTDTFVKKKTQSDEKKSDRLPGGQKGHPGSTLKTLDSPHEIIDHRLCNYKNCDHSLLQIEANDYEKRQEVDIPTLNFIVTEHHSEIKKCPYCGYENKANFPENITKPVKYGPRVLAIAIYLRDFQLVPYGRISRALRIFLD
jgi:transposase